MTAAAPAQHVIVIHRWRDGGTLYEPFLDHLLVDVSYIVPPAAAASVPHAAAAVEVVRRTDDLAALATAAARLRQRFGPPSRIVALAAADLDAAAELRVLLGCAGETPTSQPLLRDRHAMLSAVAAAGIEVPRFAVVSQGSDVFRLLAEQPGPVVLTPRFGSADDLVIRTPAEVERLGGRLDEPMLARVIEATARYAVDGVWDGGRLLSWRAARYLGPEAGDPFGPVSWRAAVELDGTAGAAEPAQLAEFATAVLAVLVPRPAVVHLEAFGQAGADGQPRLSLGWVSTGLTGAELPLLWREVHGIDLAAAAIASQLGQPLPELPPLSVAGPEPVGGWLRVFPPVPPPCLVEAVDFRPGEPAPYAAVLPRVGERLPAGEPVAASMRFRGASSAAVTRAIRAAVAGLRLRCTPL
ncbi:MAG: biotin carboxylase [Jatrophihabitantaceae bacterium]